MSVAHSHTAPVAQGTTPATTPASTPSPLMVGRAAKVTLEVMPLDPASVLLGNPQVRRGGSVRNADGWGATHFWDCTAGRIRMQSPWDETALIVEGDARLIDERGNISFVRAGDTTHIPAHTTVIWDVSRYVRKIAFTRRPVPKPVRVLLESQRRVAAVFASAVLAIATAASLVLRKLN